MDLDYDYYDICVCNDKLAPVRSFLREQCNLLSVRILPSMIVDRCKQTDLRQKSTCFNGAVLCRAIRDRIPKHVPFICLFSRPSAPLYTSRKAPGFSIVLSTGRERETLDCSTIQEVRHRRQMLLRLRAHNKSKQRIKFPQHVYSIMDTSVVPSAFILHFFYVKRSHDSR